MKLSTVGFYSVVLGVIALDQAVKAWVRSALAVGGTIPIWKDVFELSHAQNEGMAFSLLTGQRWLLAAAAVIVAMVIIVAQRRIAGKTPLLLGLALALPLGGALGNLIDRVWQGYVTDLFYFKLINFPVFNIADSAITVGMGLLFWYTLTVQEPATKENSAPNSATTTTTPSNEPS